MVDSLQLRAVSAGQGHGDEQHLFRAKGTAQFMPFVACLAFSRTIFKWIEITYANVHYQNTL